MEINQVIDRTIKAISSVQHSRLFETERGYQAELYCALKKSFGKIMPPGAILESEYQKRMSDHGLTRRPDIIIHIPRSPEGLPNVANHVVYELKRVTEKQSNLAIKDYLILDETFSILEYKIGFFININSDKHFLERYSGPYKDRIHGISVRRENNELVIIHAYFVNGGMEEEQKRYPLIESIAQE
jgi:hypothetical protein